MAISRILAVLREMVEASYPNVMTRLLLRSRVRISLSHRLHESLEKKLHVPAACPPESVHGGNAVGFSWFHLSIEWGILLNIWLLCPLNSLSTSITSYFSGSFPTSYFRLSWALSLSPVVGNVKVASKAKSADCRLILHRRKLNWDCSP